VVRDANITIIEGHGASQYGIGIVSARIAEMILRDERAIVAIGSDQTEFGVTLSLPSVVGRGGITAILPPQTAGAGERRQQSQGRPGAGKALTELVARPPDVRFRRAANAFANQFAKSALFI